MRARAGFTVVEVLLAIILIDVGLLALVATSAVLVRETNALRMRNAAYRAARNRLEQLGGATCQPATGVATSVGGISEEWTVTIPAPRVLDVRDSVTYTVGTTARSVVLRTSLPC
jgi:Tfp pilus assembly protein PilV